MTATRKAIRVDHLHVDPTVQRSLDERWVATKITKEGFIPAAMGALTVSHRSDGSYHVIDGQHRRALALQAGMPEFLAECIVHEGLSRGEEAALFRHLNDRRAVSPIDKFLVRVIEGEPVAVSISRLLQGRGWKVSSNKDDATFAAVKAIETIYRGAGIRPEGKYPYTVDLVIHTITEAWGHQSEGVRGEIISGLGMLLLLHENEIDMPKLLSEMAAMEGGPLGLIGKARGLRALRGGRVAESVADILIMAHNKSKRINKLPDWRAA